ncbi:unnamed protein product [Adineta steineri]|uniref:F-box domain-containing protein n=1 Tax=Adineta steineri TaxID=433720 RepID=A0A814N7H2_9BILA|nr:unnamed protein product [Adineta steineri]CAF1089379.1 unnamed protein product [Adineta steineri]
MSTTIHNYPFNPCCFEDLPDEILLSICSYLSQVNILDSLLNLNKRLNKTIISYRERIFLSHLSYKDFYHLMNDYLPHLSPNVHYLYINNCGMLNTGKIFEQKFDKIDRQFPLLRELVFNQIDIETLENLSWRFNTMNCLSQLNIDIADNRISTLPVQFDEFLCGKLFSVSNSFQSLILNLNQTRFSLQSINHKCLNIRHLTISVKCLNDLLIIFDNFSNIEQLNITIGCNSLSNNDTYSYEQLWWKIPSLTKFNLSIKEKELTSHDNVISSEIIMKIIQNIYQLVHVKFTLDITFQFDPQFDITKDIYKNKYFPYANGSLWEQALQRNDNRSIHFELYIEINGLPSPLSRRVSNSAMFQVDKTNDVSLNSLLATTYSSSYWLQKNITIQCFSITSQHVSIYTLPITDSSLSTTTDMIEQIITATTPPSYLYIKNLSLDSSIDYYYSSKLLITKLFTRFPYLTYLKINGQLLLPSSISTCSNHLRSLSLSNYSFSSCCELLNYLPKVISLTLPNLDDTIISKNTRMKPILSITRLKLTTSLCSVINLIHLSEYFPNVKEFYMTITNKLNQHLRNSDECEEVKYVLQRFKYLRFVEVILPIKQTADLVLNWIRMLDTNETICENNAASGFIIVKTWLKN